MVVFTADSSTIYYIHNDHLGTPQKITNASQQVVWAADYEPFGNVSLTVNNLTFDTRFPGQHFDAESGLHYNYFRDYDPEIGRYIQSDPIGLNGGINTYGYGYQNPVSNIDLFGLEVIGSWGNKPTIDFNGGSRRNSGACTGRALADCYFSGSNGGLSVEIFFWIEVIVSNGLLNCEDTETCESWTVDTEGFYQARDFTIEAPNPAFCSAAKTAGGITKPWFFCPLVTTADVFTKWGRHKEEALEAAKQYISGFTPEVRAKICQIAKGS
ncbi:RHS repeat domain-containing protein [Marinagarivorans algicola]|uniref:RHS repeat domain-containing protein n=1 Tax=Marinagarivorans algicola TaxID=1513270 RepID=UPI0037358957